MCVCVCVCVWVCVGVAKEREREGGCGWVGGCCQRERECGQSRLTHDVDPHDGKHVEERFRAKRGHHLECASPLLAAAGAREKGRDRGREREREREKTPTRWVLSVSVWAAGALAVQKTPSYGSDCLPWSISYKTSPHLHYN